MCTNNCGKCGSCSTVERKPHKHAELIKAWADGAKIQYKTISGEWRDADNPLWKQLEYRIKPEPKPDIVEEGYFYFHPTQKEVYKTLNPSIGELVRWTIDGETGRIKNVELLDK